MADWYFRNNQQSGLQSCPGCRNLVRKNETYCPYCARQLRSRSDHINRLKKVLGGPEVATRLLLAAICLMFLVQIVADMFVPARYADPRQGDGLFSLLAVNGITYIRLGSNYFGLTHFYHQYWRLLSYSFLHLGIFHILFNGYALWNLGRLAERMWGSRQVFATFILTGIGGGLARYLVCLATKTPINSLGASGAICGLLGLFLGSYYRGRYHIGEFLGSNLIRWAVYILVFGLVMRADNAAHVGGMLSGAALGYFLPPTSTTRTLTRDRAAWDILFWISAALLVITYIFVIINYGRLPGM